MDSCNSGSLQSSSGGDEEYDSRNESISAFLNPAGHVSSISNPSHHHHLPPHHHHQTHLSSSSSSALFEPNLSNYLDAFSRSPPPVSNTPNSMLNFDMVWPRGLRSEPTCTEFPTGGLMSSSSQTQTQPVPGGRVGPFHGSSSMPMPLHPLPPPENGSRPSGSSDQTAPNPVRNSKKRSRASRRAPTTVLTTDTSNFRAMVQEFTGIPAPPFPASPFPRSRLDLFSTASTTMRSSHHLDPSPPSYLLRPFAQKFHPPSFASSASTTTSSSSSSIVDVINASAAAANTTSGGGAPILTASGSSNASNSDLGLTKQTQNLLNMQNPILTFQSLLQSTGPSPPGQPPRYPLANGPVFGTKSQESLPIPSNDSSQLRMGTTVMENFTIGGQSWNGAQRW
ncbi:uncharacterized protein DDB_G0271670-like [Telopea speciosissima]|uniref:uncharacterized protein DDB_G0271670-like n=1 Tax=Telopea speciosissima TaxID=54955 RepID=UPI001CC3DA68|nr:uncharacterized protein DDB_G0271670-like [Telopea speciosissima]XP_043719004.1 uncharacterized protein DDB_G0271670-like [Telopea speciosissima]